MTKSLYRLSLTTGAATPVAVASGAGNTAPHRVVYDSGREKAYGWRFSDHQLLEVNLTTALGTAIGETHPLGTYANAALRGFMSAPASACP